MDQKSPKSPGDRVDEVMNTPGGLIGRGVVFIGVALAIYFWARAHSPHMGFGEMLTNLNGWVINEPVYSFILIVAAVIAIFGGVAIVRGLQAGRS